MTEVKAAAVDKGLIQPAQGSGVEAAEEAAHLPEAAQAHELQASAMNLYYQTDAGYTVNREDGRVAAGPYQGEPVGRCDARWGGSLRDVYRLTGIRLTAGQARCLRAAWGLNEDAFVLDMEKRPLGTYCIEKMDPGTYELYLKDEQFSGYKQCLSRDQIKRLEKHLTIKEPSALREFMFYSLVFGAGVTTVVGLYKGLTWGVLKLVKRLRNGPPPPPPSGGGGETPEIKVKPASSERSSSSGAPRVLPLPVPFVAEAHGAEFTSYAPDGYFAPHVRSVPLAEAVRAPDRKAIETMGLIGAAAISAVLMFYGGTAAMSMGLQGATAGGAVMISPYGSMGHGGEA